MKKSALIFFCISLFFLDFFTKKFMILHMNEAMFAPLYSLTLLPGIDCSIVYVENTGMAWGMLSSFQWVIFAFRVTLVLFLLFGLFYKDYIKKRYFSYMLIAFGALGNIVDTVLYGHVIDMIHCTFWGRSYGVFNIADAMIFIGAFSAVIQKEEKHEQLE